MILGGLDDRGQTAFDFVVGMTIFLVTVGFIMTFIPGVFDPFTVSSGSDALVSDRAAASLSADLLVEDPTSPTILNKSCTISFFAGSLPADGCRFDDKVTDDTVEDVLGFPDARLNVTIRNPRTDKIASPFGSDLNVGDAPSPDADVTTARRLVYIDGELYELRVRVW